MTLSAGNSEVRVDKDVVYVGRCIQVKHRSWY